MSELLLYNYDDGRTRLDLRIEGPTVWLTQLEVAEHIVDRADASQANMALTTESYEDFDTTRRNQEAIAADAEGLKAIEELEKELKRKGGKA